MLEMYPLLHDQCLSDATKFRTLGENIVMNLSIIWHNFSPFKTSTSPFSSLFSRCSKKKYLLIVNAMASWVAHSVQNTFSLTKDLTCWTNSLEQLLAIWWSHIHKWITIKSNFPACAPSNRCELRTYSHRRGHYVNNTLWIFWPGKKTTTIFFNYKCYYLGTKITM